MPHTVVALLLAGMLTLCACEIVSDSDRSIPEEHLYDEIMKEIGTPTATSLSSCKFIPFGAKACGGPAGYGIYSTEKSDVARLERLVAQFNELDAKRVRDEGGYSDCSIPPAPEIELVGGVCTRKNRE